MSIKNEDFVSSGSTILNLSHTGKSKCGYKKGTYNLLVGDSNSGKTFIVLNTLAQATINQNFDDYELHYNGPEGGAKMDIQKLYGKKADERIQREYASETVEEFWDWIDTLLKGPPFIAILDSMDSLTCDADNAHIAKQKEAREQNKESKGSYGVEKAKINSQRLRKAVPKLEKHGSILNIISQTRDALGSTFQEKTFAGGKSLKFYADIQEWFAVREKLTKTYKKKKLQIGTRLLVKVKRTRYTGKEREAEIIIYTDTGIDDIGANIEFLIDWKHWTNKGGVIVAKEFNVSGSFETVVKKIEDGNKQNKLRLIVAGVWKSIENAIKIERKSQYE